MCLIAVAFQAHSEFPLVLAANRDELFSRPTRPAAFWPDVPDVLAGRDLLSGGSWLGVSAESGRVAAVTNGQGPVPLNARSRGELVSDFLAHPAGASHYLADRAAAHGRYAPFYLLAGSAAELHHLDGTSGRIRALQPGIHVILNQPLERPSPKADRAIGRLQEVLDRGPTADGLLDLLADDKTYPEEAPRLDGVSTDIARATTAFRVRSDSYGTRSSTAVLMHRDGEIRFVEREYRADGSALPDRAFRFERSPG